MNGMYEFKLKSMTTDQLVAEMAELTDKITSIGRVMSSRLDGFEKGVRARVRGPLPGAHTPTTEEVPNTEQAPPIQPTRSPYEKDLS